MSSKTPAQFTRDVVCCARCQQDHKNVKFDEVSNAPPYASHYGICPTTLQWIFMRVRTDRQKCIVHECPNEQNTGVKFVEDICVECHDAIVTGRYAKSKSFLRNLTDMRTGEQKWIVGWEDAFGPYYMSSMNQGVVAATVDQAYAMRFGREEEAEAYVVTMSRPRGIPPATNLYPVRVSRGVGRLVPR